MIFSLLLKIYGDYDQSSGDTQPAHNSGFAAAEAFPSDKIFQIACLPVFLAFRDFACERIIRRIRKEGCR